MNHPATDSIGSNRNNIFTASSKRITRFYSILIFLLSAIALLGAALASGNAVVKPSISSKVAAPSLLKKSNPTAVNIREASGANAAAIQTTVDTFRTDLGTLRPNTTSSFPDGRREINWDGVPDSFSAPSNLPADFFNNNSPRGAVFSTPGTGFQVSMDDDNPADADPDQVRFDNLNSTYSSQFNVFSAQRLFTALNSNVTDITFFVPGTNIPATVTGFGAVFTDVDSTGSTSIQFFDAVGNLLLIRNVLATPGTQSLSFLGVSFTNGQRVSRARITSGNSALGPNDNPGAGVDIVVMDDFIYAEPQPAVCPPQTITGNIGQGSGNYPSTSGVQTGRIVQNGVDSACAAPKTCPGLAINGGSFAFDAYQFANNSNATVCVSFNFPAACGGNNSVHPVAYLGSFDPANPCTNYLGDVGHSINAADSGAFSVNVPANSIVVLVVHETGTQPGCQGYSFSVSGLPPCPPTGGCTLTCPANITQSNTLGQCGAVVNFPAPTTSGQCGAITCNPPSGSFFPVGTTTVTCTEGNSSANCSFTVTINDTQPPTITCPANIIRSNDPNQCGAVVTYPAPTVSDNCPGVGTPNCSPASGSFFPVGTTTVTCTVADASPNSPDGTCTFTITVNDTQPPQITCPANVTAVTDQNVCPAPACLIVNFPAPVVSDNCPSVTVVCNPPAGSCLPVGVTTVTCTATDASGNTATCSFSVTTFDTALQDDSNPATILLWNSITGQYRFCCNGITFTGVGKATRQGCVYTLEHNPADRRVLGRVDKAVHAGSGSIQAPPGTTRCTITDRNTLNDTNLTSCQ